MTERYNKGQALMKNAQYQLAYQEFSQIIDSNQNDYQAYYYRGIVDFYYLKENLTQTKLDFEKVIQNLPKYAHELYGPLTILSNIANEPDQTIVYGEKALTNPRLKSFPNLVIEINFALSRAYYLRGASTLDYLKSLNYLDTCLKMSDDEAVELHLCKCEVLLELEAFDDVLSILDLITTKFEFRPAIYFIKGRALSEKPKGENSDESYRKQLEEAVYCFDTFLKYEENDPFAMLHRAITLRKLGEVNDAIHAYQLLSQIRSPENPNNDELVVDMMITYDVNDKFDEAIKLADEYLEKEQSWRIIYAKAQIISNRYPEQLESMIPFFKQAYELSKRTFIAMGILDAYQRLQKLDECYNWLKKLIDEFPNEGRWYYYMGDIMLKLNYSYEEVTNYYLDAYILGYIDELECYDMIFPLLEKPKLWYKKLKKQVEKANNSWNNDLVLIEVGSAHKMSLRYLYGMFNHSVNHNLALKYAIFCQKIFPKDCCLNVNLGRVHEFSGNYQESFACYQKAKSFTDSDVYPLCHCSYGYLANSYLLGLGTRFDKEKAKTLIQKAINVEGEVSDSSILYLYAYFALIGEEGFCLNKAIHYLEHHASFLRYEITRFQLLKQLYQKTSSPKIKTCQKSLKKALRYDSIKAKQYYYQHRYDEVYYPFLNHY